MARINVEQSALTDPRFLHLGQILRCPKRFAAHAARGIMEHVWNHLTEHWSEDGGPGAYCVTSTTLRRLFDGASYGPRLGLDMVSAGLAEQTEFGFRIRGTLGRIEWLNRRREAARDNGKLGGRKPNSVNPPSLAPSPSPSPAQKQEREKSPAAEKRDGFAAHAFQTWETTEGSRPPWGKTEYIALAEARKRLETDERAASTWDRYLSDPDPFFAGHPPGKFLSQLSRFAGKAPRGPVTRETVHEHNKRAGEEWFASKGIK